MESKKIEPIKKISGKITLPGDKSISHRAVMIGSISKGKTIIKNLLDCDDCNYTIRAFKDMGITIEKDKECIVIQGKGLRGLKNPEKAIYVGASGTTMRLLAGILAGQDFETTIEADESLSARPMKRIVEPLSLMGADIKARDDEYSPLKIKGSALEGISYKMPVSSAQVKSAILLAGLYAGGVTNVQEMFKSRDHTERMLEYFGADLKVQGLKISLKGGGELSGKSFEIPGDISSASFFLVAATLLKDSKVRINKVSMNPTRIGVIKILEKMGADVKILNKKDIFEPVGDIIVESPKALKGIIIEEGIIPNVIDELPIIFVLAALSKGRTVIKGAGELKVKETDRIRSMKTNLKKMGARIEIDENDIVIDGVDELKGARLESLDDHRTCMAVTIAALAAKGESTIDDAKCVNKSFPLFFKTLEGLKG